MCLTISLILKYAVASRFSITYFLPFYVILCNRQLMLQQEISTALCKFE